MICAWPGCDEDWRDSKLRGHPIMYRLCSKSRRFCRTHDAAFDVFVKLTAEVIHLDPESERILRTNLWNLYSE